MQDNFIMLPTIDFCFKELMQNPKVRKGFIAALLKIRPEDIRETTLLPAVLRREAADDKLGILDAHIRLENGTQLDIEMQVEYFRYWDKRVLFYLGRMYTGQLKKGESYEKLKKCIHVSILDFICFPEDTECYRTIHFRDDRTGRVYTDMLEIQILELKKLPKKIQSGDEIMNWMKFFGGKSREEFEIMAKTNEYLDEAYQELMQLSADDLKRLEYEARERALRDYNSQMASAREIGMEQGIEEGIKQGMEQGMKQGMEQGMKTGIEALIEACRDFNASREETILRLTNKFKLTQDEAEKYIDEYWN